MTQLTDVGLNDYAYCYPVLDQSMAQGTQLDDIIGEQIKMKYLYLGFHLQNASTGSLPVTLRVMVVQDRNYREYNGGVPTPVEMYKNLFGLTANTVPGSYIAYSDVTLLPYNPLQPGRFRIIRDFKMNIAPGWRQDYYKKCIILQRHTNSKGKIYFGPSTDTAAETSEVGWASPVGMAENSTNSNFLYFDYPVTGSNPRPDSVTTVNRGELGPYYLVVPERSEGISTTWPMYQVQQYPYIVSTQTAQEDGDPANQTITYSTSRNGIYVLILRQATPIVSPEGTVTSANPTFCLSIQSRFAYYDN